MENSYSIVWYTLIIILLDHDGGKHCLHPHNHANPVARSGDEDDEMDDVSHATDVPLLLQRLRSRIELLLLRKFAHHYSADYDLPLDHRRQESVGRDGS